MPDQKVDNEPIPDDPASPDVLQTEELPSTDDLESPLYLYDLNLLVISITQLYAQIFDKVQFERMKRRENLIRASNWIDLFIAAERNKHIYKEVMDVMGEMGLDEGDLTNLQRIRKIRNNLCHPRISIEKTISILERRWKVHPCYDSLHKCLKHLRETINRK